MQVHALLATGVNGDGHREILGVEVTSGEDGADEWTEGRRYLGIDVLARSQSANGPDAKEDTATSTPAITTAA